jgi:hypothetical protein
MEGVYSVMVMLGAKERKVHAVGKKDEFDVVYAD